MAHGVGHGCSFPSGGLGSRSRLLELTVRPAVRRPVVAHSPAIRRIFVGCSSPPGRARNPIDAAPDLAISVARTARPIRLRSGCKAGAPGGRCVLEG